MNVATPPAYGGGMSEHPIWRREPVLAMALTIAASVVLLGSVGPWLSSGVLSTNGFDSDGQITLALGGVALLLAGVSLKHRSLRLDAVAALSLTAAGAIGLYNWLSGQAMLWDGPT